MEKKDYLLKLKETVLTKERKNLKALDALLDYHDDDNDRILKAEIYRELGKFKDAGTLLEQPFDEKFSQTVSLIKELIQKQDPFVAEIKPSE